MKSESSKGPLLRLHQKQKPEQPISKNIEMPAEANNSLNISNSK